MKIVEEPIGGGTITLYDFEPTPDRICEDVADGLGRSPKMLPSKYLYDAEGARLFERITDLEAYYPTRTEISILERHAAEMAERIGAGAALIEFGSGSGEKTWIVLRHLTRPAAYIPVDISRAQLAGFSLEVAEAFPNMDVVPVCADYTADFAIPRIDRPVGRRVAFFPGSTIGNFEQADAREFLGKVKRLVGADGGLLLGLDLLKDPAVIERAYNDPEGVTAEFNLNLLTRINRECGADFDTSAFRHHAIFDAAAGRIEMRLISQHEQTVRVASDDGGPELFHFAAGEYIITEYSHKYDLADFRGLAGQAGWEVEKIWEDSRNWFAVVLLRAGRG